VVVVVVGGDSEGGEGKGGCLKGLGAEAKEGEQEGL